ncbi:MAG: hypothetical protein GY906_04640 [bacterium]|nr:hypothetical protein [bacterium]
MKIRFLSADPRFIACDNEGAEGEPLEQAPEATPEPSADSNGTFTQDQVNEIVVKRNKKVRQQLETTEKQYESLLKSQNLSANEKAELQGQLDNLQTQLRTKEQQAAYEAKKQRQEYDAKLEQTTGQLDHYKGLFETQTRDNAIMSAASKHDAYNPQQFIDVLGPRTKIVDEVNENGEKTGRLVPRVEMTMPGEDGTPTGVQVTPDEAIEIMKNDVSQFGNLFRGNVAKGIGEGSNTDFAGSSRVDISKMSDEEYFANREQIRKQYGIRDRRGL